MCDYCAKISANLVGYIAVIGSESSLTLGCFYTSSIKPYLLKKRKTIIYLLLEDLFVDRNFKGNLRMTGCKYPFVCVCVCVCAACEV